MIFHLALPEDWDRARSLGFYDVSTRGASIAEVGFLHASRDLEQAKVVAAAFYAGVSPLVLLRIDEAAFDSYGLEVRHEAADPSDPASPTYPHVYGGALPLAAITATPWPPSDA